jgi:hypothetical protein
MNTHNYKHFLIKSKLLSKIHIIYNNFINDNYYYIQNLKDFIEFYIDDNKCNITNNNILNQLLNNMNVWNLYDVNNKKSIYDDLSIFIYNYDYTDNEMYDLLVELESLIV